MPSPDAGSVDLPMVSIGGRVSQYDPQGLPAGAGIVSQDLIYSGADAAGRPVVTGAATRPGTGSGFYAAAFAGNPTINYLRTFIDSRDIFHLLSLDSLGNIRDENPCPEPPGVPTIIGSVVAASYAQSDTLLNREWMAISDPLSGFGIDIPRQWDGTTYARVSQTGPGIAPTPADYQVQGNIAASPNGLVPVTWNLLSITENADNSVSVLIHIPVPVDKNSLKLPRNGDPVNISGATVVGYDGDYTISSGGGSANLLLIPTFTIASGLAAATGTLNTSTVVVAVTNSWAGTPEPNGLSATIAGAGVAGYNTTVLIRYSNTNFNWMFVYLPMAWTLAASGGGTITTIGNISAGLHLVSVSYVNKFGYITKPAPWSFWTAAGNNAALLTGIPTGPPSVVSRIVMFTPVITPPATEGPFYYLDGSVQVNANYTLPSMVIPDNVTTMGLFDFIDAVLENATASTSLFALQVLGECSATCAYSEREFWAGERNRIINLLNMDFDGGFDVTNTIPQGWSLDGVNGPGGSLSPDAYWTGGGAYRITGDGVTIIRGMIFQGAYQDYLGASILSPQTSYSIRARLKVSAGATGFLNVDVYSPSQGGVLISSQIDLSTLTQSYKEYIVPMLYAPLAIPRPDMILRLYTSGTVPNGATVDVYGLELFPTLQPYNSTLVRGSYALDPESFDQTTGFLIVGADDGLPVRAMFTLLDNKLYMVKETGLYSTADDGANEPNLWAIDIISKTMGTSSAQGVGTAETWAVIAHKTGAYIFWGSEPIKITQEIQPDWDSINWNAAHTIYVVIDTAAKRIHIGAPVGDATTPNVEFVCDYSLCTGPDDIAAHPQAYYSVYNPSRAVSPGKARRWSLWNISMNSAALTQRSDGEYDLLRGNGVGNGKIYNLVPGQTNDDGATIKSQWQTYYLPGLEDEQALQLGAHRKLFKYMTGYVCGSGLLKRYMMGVNGARTVQLASIPLQNPAIWDFESNMNFIAERASLLIETDTLDSWFHISPKLIFTLQREIVTPVRGTA
jgi:hypothetical protein